MQVSEINDFVGLTVRKRGGFTGVDSTLTIDKSMSGNVAHNDGRQHSFELDARSSEDLLHAMTRVASSKPNPSEVRGADMFHYDIELQWNGHTYKVNSVDLGADEALHGLMMVATQLMGTSGDSMSIRSSVHDDNGLLPLPGPDDSTLLPLPGPTDNTLLPLPGPDLGIQPQVISDGDEHGLLPLPGPGDDAQLHVMPDDKGILPLPGPGMPGDDAQLHVMPDDKGILPLPGPGMPGDDAQLHVMPDDKGILPLPGPGMPGDDAQLHGDDPITQPGVPNPIRPIFPEPGVPKPQGAGNDNPGIVPPWLGIGTQAATDAAAAPAGENPGIVPPWLGINGGPRVPEQGVMPLPGPTPQVIDDGTMPIAPPGAGWGLEGDDAGVPAGEPEVELV